MNRTSWVLGLPFINFVTGTKCKRESDGIIITQNNMYENLGDIVKFGDFIVYQNIKIF